MVKRSKRAVKSAARSKRGNSESAREQARKTKAPARKPAKRIGRSPATRAQRRSAGTETPARKQRTASLPDLPVESAIIDVIEEPVPGVLVVSEFEAVRVTVPDSDENRQPTSE